MTDPPEAVPQDPDDIFGEVISRYTRAQALEDGMLVDVTERAREAGIRIPVAVTRAVWSQYVELTRAAEEAGCNVTGRLWDVLWMFRCAAVRRPNAGELHFELYVVTDRIEPSPVTLKAIVGPGDDGEPVITILLPDED